jgi:hypothetical protein
MTGDLQLPCPNLSTSQKGSEARGHIQSLPHLMSDAARPPGVNPSLKTQSLYQTHAQSSCQQPLPHSQQRCRGHQLLS